MSDGEQKAVQITDASGLTKPLMHNGVNWRGAELIIKRATDIVLSAALILLLAPLLLLVALGVRLTSDGPAVYAQLRLGRGGESFRFYKFRSMRIDADKRLAEHLAENGEAKIQWDRYQKLTHDPRITAFGLIIRKTSLDELPQLYNVLRGDMSLVGPRPCMVEQKRLYGDSWASYCMMRPGLTGLWQVSGRNKLTYDERVELDRRYVDRWSLKLDFMILLKTVKVVFTGAGSA